MRKNHFLYGKTFLLFAVLPMLSGCAALTVDAQHGRVPPPLSLCQETLPQEKECSQVERNAREELQKMFDNHVIALDERGHLAPLKLKPDPRCPTTAGTPPASDSSQDPLKNLLTTLDQWVKKHQCGAGGAQKPTKEECDKQAPPELVLFIHGGLNDYNDTLDRIQTDARAMMAENDNPSGGKKRYPIFIAWPSDLFDSYADSLFNYDQGLWSDGMATKLADDRTNILYDLYPNAFSPYFMATDLLEMVARLPVNTAHTVTNIFANHYATPEKIRKNKLLDCLKADSPWGNVVNPDLFAQYFGKAFHCESDDASGMNNVTAPSDTVYNGLLSPVKMVALPLIDSMGRRAWISMKARSRLAFRRPCPYLLADTDEWTNGVCDRSPLSRFLDHLNETFSSRNDLKLTINLIGHSMGTMVAGKIVNQYPDLPYANVVFIGAAISIGNFLSQVQPVMVSRMRRGQTPFHFYNLSLHPYAEMRSIENAFSPEGSLLEWIDIMFESPATMEDRTLGKWTNSVSSIPFFNQELLNSGYMHFKRFGLRDDSPLKHSEMVSCKHQADQEETCGNKKICVRKYWEEAYWKVAEDHRVKPVPEEVTSR